MVNNITDQFKVFGLRKILDYLDKDPDKNIPKIINWIEKIDRNEHVSSKLDAVKELVEDKDGNWYDLIETAYTDIDEDVRKTLFENFLINSAMLGLEKEKESREKYACNVPWAILMDPTSACNLRCTGCWAADYGNKLSMSYETLDNIIEQGKELGIYMYIYSGGEPMMRKSDIIKLCEKHSDCVFLAFTNGTLIDNKFADEMLRVKNFVPAISVEGFEAETDFRRGEGTYKSVENAMKILKNKRLPFGISCCYTSQNVESMGSEEYFDDMIEKGAKFAWFFTYMPVGINAVPELMVSAQQRAYMRKQIRKFRESKAIFTMDFWNDGEYVDGCIAGGRRYLHINANGDIEPCAFIHYSDSNIYDHTLLEALQRPLFMQYKENQPFNENHLRPCPLLDNKNRLAEMVDKSNADSTDLENPEDVHHLCGKCEEAADSWGVLADEIWEQKNKKVKF